MALALIGGASADARADDSVAISAGSSASDETAAPNQLEAGLFTGGFISNFFHQFYDVSIPNREELNRVSPQLGVRFAYFPHELIGAEAEASWIMAETKMTGRSAPMLWLRAQAVGRYPIGRVTPFAVAGLSIARMMSDDDVLGSDTDLPIHIGAGAQVELWRSISLRAEGRFIRGPSSKDPYTLDASYGEFLIGVSFNPMAVASSGDSSERIAVPAPLPDPDGDGIAGDRDECPNQAGAQPDGCPSKELEPVVTGPPPDTDEDGIPDPDDKCPNIPEDMDGYRDRDGCDDPDNDGDGIPDVIDQCALEPETINSNEDDDGCPDEGDSLVMLAPAQIEVFEPVRFRGSTATLHPSASRVLHQVAATLRANREIIRLRIDGHVHPRGAIDQTLSKKRADAVREWMLQWGVEPERLETRGSGSNRPLVEPSKKGAKALNDRIEFVILEKAIPSSQP